MHRYTRVAVVVVLLAGAGLLVPRIVSSGDSARDVRIVARDMTYYLDGQEEPNPELRFKPGERIRLTFRNEDAGLTHDFRIRAWDVGTKLLEGKGQAEVVFRVPSKTGPENYACTPHTAMMSGRIVVE
jgi:plastocyanin